MSSLALQVLTTPVNEAAQQVLLAGTSELTSREFPLLALMQWGPGKGFLSRIAGVESSTSRQPWASLAAAG